MRTLISTSVAAMIFATSAAPAHADIFGSARKWFGQAGRDVAKTTTTAANTVADAGKTAVNKVGGYGATAGEAIKDTAVMAKDKAVAGAQVAWDGAKWVGETLYDAGDTLISGNAGERQQLARDSYASFKRIEPIMAAFMWQTQNTKDGLVVINHLRKGEYGKSARALMTLGAFDEVLAAADAMGMKTVTVGLGGDCSVGVGYVSEIGIAIDVASGLINMPERGLRGYSTIGYTLGLSAGCDVALAMGMWKPHNGALAGDSWGSVVAAAPGGGASGGAWFDYSDANRGLGAFQGITFAPSVGVSVEIGEINRVRTEQF